MRIKGSFHRSVRSGYAEDHFRIVRGVFRVGSPGTLRQFLFNQLGQGENVGVHFPLIGAFDHHAHQRFGTAGTDHQPAPARQRGLCRL